MGIRLKILSGFVILALMLFLAGIWSIYELTTIGSSVQMLLDDNYKSISAAKQMGEALERQDSAVLLLLSGKWDEGRSISESAHNQFQTAFRDAKSNVTIQGEEDLIRKIQSSYEAYRQLWIRPIVDTSREKNLQWYFTTVHPAFQNAKASVAELMTLNDQTMYQTASGLENRAHRAVMPGIVAILAALIFTLMFNYLINYYIVSPIIDLTDGIQKFITNQRPLNLKVQTNDEIFQLSNSVRELMTKCRSPRETA